MSNVDDFDIHQTTSVLPALKKQRVYRTWKIIFSSVDNLNGINDKDFHRNQCMDFVNSTFKHNYLSVTTTCILNNEIILTLFIFI